MSRNLNDLEDDFRSILIDSDNYCKEKDLTFTNPFVSEEEEEKIPSSSVGSSSSSSSSVLSSLQKDPNYQDFLSSISQNSSLSVSQSSSPMNPTNDSPTNVSLIFNELEQKIRSQKSLTKTLSDKQKQLAPQFLEELKKRPNATLETDQMTFSLRQKKRKRKIDGEIIVKSLASYLENFNMVPNDETKRKRFHDIENSLRQISQKELEYPENEQYKVQRVFLLQKKSEFFIFLAMEIMNFIERHRPEEIKPFLSKRRKKRRLDINGYSEFSY